MDGVWGKWDLTACVTWMYLKLKLGRLYLSFGNKKCVDFPLGKIGRGWCGVGLSQRWVRGEPEVRDHVVSNLHVLKIVFIGVES